MFNKKKRLDNDKINTPEELLDVEVERESAHVGGMVQMESFRKQR